MGSQITRRDTLIEANSFLFIPVEANLFEKVSDFPGLVRSLIQCADFASKENQRLTEPFMPNAVNAFKYEKSAQTCTVGSIRYKFANLFHDKIVLHSFDQ